MKKRITALLLLLTLSVTSLFACTSADKSESASDKTAKTSKSTSTKKQELTPVTLNEVAHSIFYAPMYVAIEKGYFANEGIDLSLVTGFGADKTMTAVLSGTADIGFMGSEASIYTYNEGANDYVVNFAQLTQRAGNFLVAREDIKDFKWEDLKGKKVIGGRKGGNDSEGCHGATVMIPDSTVKFKPQSLQQSSNTSLTGTRSRLQVICPRILSKDRFTLRLFSIAMVFNKSATEKLVTERSIGSL